MRSRSSVTEAGAPGELRRVLGPFTLMMIGVGSAVGAGIFVMTGTVAAQWAGPAVTIAYAVAGLVCLLVGLCYAELAAMMPVAGSAYSYASAAMGKRIAWVIALCLMLEYLIAASTIAVGWSGYATDAARRLGVIIPHAFSSSPLVLSEAGHLVMSGSLVNLPAVLIVLAMSWLLAIGVRESTLANTLMVLLKVGVILLVIVCGAAYVNPENWQPFIPPNTGEPGEFGWTGIARASGVIFYAYIGFETISTCAQETRRPQRDLAIAILGSLLICTLLYMAMGLVVTGLAHYSTLNVAHPIMVALDSGGQALDWLKPMVSVGVVVGLASTILVTLYGQSRIFYTMAVDKALPKAFSRVHPRRGTPSLGIWVAGLVCAMFAGLFPLDMLGELVSMGTLLAFAAVCISVLILRRKVPEAARPFRVPFGPVLPALAAAACFYMMYSLSWTAWVWLLGWIAVGLLIQRPLRQAEGPENSAAPGAAHETPRLERAPDAGA